MVSYISIERDSSGPLTHPDCLLSLAYPLAGEARRGDREEGSACLVGDRLAYEGLARTCISREIKERVHVYGIMMRRTVITM